jgi:hypothetical protein
VVAVVSEEEKSVSLRAVALAHIGWHALHGNYLPISKLMSNVSDDVICDLMDEHEVKRKVGGLEPLEDQSMTYAEAVEVFDSWVLFAHEYMHAHPDEYDSDDLLALEEAFLVIRGDENGS